jgi:putative spermidine/putrescine transport system permease protein
MAGVTVGTAPAPSRRRARPARSRGRTGRWRYPVLILAGLYFLAPLYAALRFALKDNSGKFSTKAFTSIPHQTGFTSAFGLSIRLALITTVITLLLMVPTAVYIHLRLPKLRRLFDGVTLLPIVIPPVVLIVGVLQVAPTGLKSTPYLLGLEYAVLAIPFSYRALDAGLAAIDVRTLFDAARSLGGGSFSTLMRVILPNMRPALLSATVLTVALVLGEYTMASLALFQTFPVWIVLFDAQSGQVSVAVSLLALFVTWLILLAISSLDHRRTKRRGTVTVTEKPSAVPPVTLLGQGAPV